MKKKIGFIINPISGIGKQKTVEALINQHLNKSLFEHEIMYTNAPQHATLLAKEAIKNNFNIVAAVGGDGSINEIGKALIGSKTALAILPAGSGNGLARHLGIPLNLTKALELIHQEKSLLIDTATLNNECFLNVAGVGFDAHIGWEFSQFGKRGFSSYIKLILREFPAYKEQEYEITIDGKTIQTNAFLITIANGSQWGNNVQISPNSVINDGVLEVAILKNVTPLNFVPLAIKLLTKQLHKTKNLEILTGKNIVIKQSKQIAHVDGEAIKPGNEIEISVNPKSLSVIVP